MASLKEIKGRIASVKSTQKITAAMKMVASAKLRKAQYQIENFLPYQTRLMEILNSFLASETEFTHPLALQREVKSVAIIAVSSNSSLCGAFNSNVIRLFNETVQKYSNLPKENVLLYPVGKKIEAAAEKHNASKMGSYQDLIDKPNFPQAKSLADEVINLFMTEKIDRVELIYNHFKSTAVQILTKEQFLPMILERDDQPSETHTGIDYIIEPDKVTILNSLIPKSLHSKIYSVILDSAAAEQAARTVAMQIATDNANDILDDLNIQFNKQRQQSITSELLDIIGGAEALK